MKSLLPFLILLICYIVVAPLHPVSIALIIEYCLVSVILVLHLRRQISDVRKLAHAAVPLFAIIVFYCIAHLFDSELQRRPPIIANSGKVYPVENHLDTTGHPYTDRTYRFKTIPPQLKGAQYVRTANDDKDSRDDIFLRFTPATSMKVYVGLDTRQSRHPAWVEDDGFKPDGIEVTTTDANFSLFERQYNANVPVHLGGNKDALSDTSDELSMYLVILNSADPGVAVAAGKRNQFRLEPVSAKVYGRSRDTGVYRSIDTLLALHDSWIVSGSASGRRLDFSEDSVPAFKVFNADVRDADFNRVIFRNNAFIGCDMSNIQMRETKADSALFINGIFTNANLTGGEFVHANFSGADLHNADLTEAQLEGADFTGANVSGTIFEPASLPSLSSIANADSLAFMRYTNYPGALIELRERFKANGMKERAREVNAAIEREEAARAPLYERGARIFLFGATSDYGRMVFKPFQLLLATILFFFPVYVLLLLYPSNTLDIESNGNKDRIKHDVFYKFLGTVCIYSFTAAFFIGWKELDINDWISRFYKQKREWNTEGWIRTVSGLQSLISFYLLVLWILIYFGNPFE